MMGGAASAGEPRPRQVGRALALLIARAPEIAAVE